MIDRPMLLALVALHRMRGPGIDSPRLTDPLADVLGEAKKLPPKAAVPAKDWLAQVEARHAVEAELGTIDLALKSSLGAGPGPPGVGPPGVGPAGVGPAGVGPAGLGPKGGK